MPNIRIANSTPDISSQNTVPNIKVRNDVPNIFSRNDVPHPRIQSGGSVSTSGSSGKTFGGKGYPIGILLAITDIKSHTTSSTTQTFVSDFKPNIRIRND